MEDWAALFKLLEADKIRPVTAKELLIVESARANKLLESGTVVGNIVLVAQDLMPPRV